VVERKCENKKVLWADAWIGIPLRPLEATLNVSRLSSSNRYCWTHQRRLPRRRSRKCIPVPHSSCRWDVPVKYILILICFLLFSFQIESRGPRNRLRSCQIFLCFCLRSGAKTAPKPSVPSAFSRIHRANLLGSIVRAFDNDEVLHVDDSIDPVRDLSKSVCSFLFGLF
jgi:hypothetical protein